MVICIQAHKIAYMAVPKVACSSIKAALCAIDANSDIPKAEIAASFDKLHIQYPTKRFRLHRWEMYKDCWRFAAVRDPLKRLLSVYTDRKEQKNDLFRSPRLRNSQLSKDPDPNYFFENLHEYSALSSVIKHHVLSTRIFLGPDLSRYNRIYRIEDLDQLATDVSRRIDAPFTIPRMNKSQHHLSANDLSKKARKVIHDHLAVDYQLLSDFYPKD